MFRSTVLALGLCIVPVALAAQTQYVPEKGTVESDFDGFAFFKPTTDVGLGGSGNYFFSRDAAIRLETNLEWFDDGGGHSTSTELDGGVTLTPFTLGSRLQAFVAGELGFQSETGTQTRANYSAFAGVRFAAARSAALYLELGYLGHSGGSHHFNFQTDLLSVAHRDDRSQHLTPHTGLIDADLDATYQIDPGDQISLVGRFAPFMGRHLQVGADLRFFRLDVDPGELTSGASLAVNGAARATDHETSTDVRLSANYHFPMASLPRLIPYAGLFAGYSKFTGFDGYEAFGAHLGTLYSYTQATALFVELEYAMYTSEGPADDFGFNFGTRMYIGR